ncbi:MAG: TRAP transporter substrate-binding protein [Eubacteriales bacterium]|nr:TRAP transporter substrate-binding protein [Eubacteriales bacterium]
MNKWFGRIAAAVLAVSIGTAGCAGPGQSGADGRDTVHLTFGHGQAEGHPYHKAALYFKDMVEEQTDGRVIVDVQPNGSLGDEREMTEGLQLGTIDITVAVAAALSGFDPNMDVFNFPYLFDDREQAFEVLDGPAGQAVFDGMKKQGIEIYGTFDLGFRSMTNSKLPIVSPEDCRGIRMRTLESSVCVDALGELGIDAVSMSFGELFTALQTGAVDGQENPLFTILNSRFYEVQEYLSLTEHFYPVCPVMVSDLVWDKLTPEEGEIVKEALKKTVDYERELAGQELDSTLEQLKEVGMQVNEVDKDAFKAAVQPVYEKYDSQYGDLLRQINEAKGGE